MTIPEAYFDQIIERAGSQCEKYDQRKQYFGRDDVTPLWVADMDFAAPPAVVAALRERAAHPVYGYSLVPAALYESVAAWLTIRHGWPVDPSWLLLAPGVVPSLHAAVLAFSQLGDTVIVQPPIYPPFFNVTAATGRRLALNPLQKTSTGYGFDWAHLEQVMAQGARLLLLCSPHNPVGRVWRREELAQLLALAERYRVLVVSDEIHADLVYAEAQHIPSATLAARPDQVITAVSPSKTFNIPGLGLSCLIVPDEGQRRALRAVFATWRVSFANPFSCTAFQTAYQQGSDWLDALLCYLTDNRDLALARLRSLAPAPQVDTPQGTYLLWLDCRALGLSDERLQRFFVEQARLGLNPGISFGEQGSGYMRLNFALPRARLLAALDQLTAVWSEAHAQ